MADLDDRAHLRLRGLRIRALERGTYHARPVEKFRLRDLALLSQQGRAVQTTRSLEEGHRDLVIPETNDVVFDENNGKLVLVADYLKVPDALVDEKYGLSIHAVKLKRVIRDLGISMRAPTTK